MADAIFTGNKRRTRSQNIKLKLFFINRTPKKAKRFSKEFHGTFFDELGTIPSKLQISYLFLLLKPQNFLQISSELSNFLSVRPKIVIISFLAATPLKFLSKQLDFSAKSIFRIMPHEGVVS